MRILSMYLVVSWLELILGQNCTNECGGDQVTNWCGQRRQGDTGKILRCAETTKDGWMCMTSCGYNDESYTWCWTGVHLNAQWDYCTPSDGQVIQVMYTIYGQQCAGKCGQQGKDYWWCYKSMRWHGSKVRDDDWDYCSRDDRHTRYNKECRDSCSPRGLDYYWCHTTDDSWDYCSPRVENIEPEVTREGGRCVGICDQRDQDYYWCHAEGINSSYWEIRESYWDYCGPNASLSTTPTAPPTCLLILLFLLFHQW